jgi:predicted molibdopterin-dependent oxidoreductase YjgC
MVVHTNNARIRAARRSVLELLLAEHPLDCLVCERTGNCALQDYAYEYGADGKTIAGQIYTERPKLEHMLDNTNKFFERDLEKCILCGRCVRMCAEVMGYGAIDFVRRGAFTRVATMFDVPLEESPCVFCGNCLTICPTGALHPKQGRRQGRSFQYEKVLTVCPYCGVGCSIYLHVREGRIIGSSAAQGPANRGLVCVKGHFGQNWIQRPDRLTTPLVRNSEGKLVAATWDEALSLIARKLTEIKSAHGPDAIAGLASAKCTNEDNYVFQRMMRAAIGTNNVDHCARLCHASTVTGLAAAFGSGAMTNSNWEFESSDGIFIIGSNTTETHPVIGCVVERGRQ